MNITPIEIIGTALFAAAVLHTFFVEKIIKFAHRFQKDSMSRNFFFLLGEIEVVFALWASLFMLVFIVLEGWDGALAFQSSLSFSEPLFIFVIMVVCSSRPILTLARMTVLRLSATAQKIFRTPQVLTDLLVLMIVGPLSGSLITEPAAMTVTASLLNSMIHRESKKIIYPVLAVLFVNISIGGALTPYAAPPILMVAKQWNWDFNYVFFNLGWKSALAVIVNAFLLVTLFSKAFSESCQSLRERVKPSSDDHFEIPSYVLFIHLLFLVGIIITSHYQNAFMGLFLLFLGCVHVSEKYHDRLRLRESLLVALFLGGIIQFGAFQSWWLTPLLKNLNDADLFRGAIALTAVTDNAALTYLGSQVADLSDSSKYALVAGAIAGGGLTVIANAPNAAGVSLLSQKLGSGLNPIRLLLFASVPTAVAILFLH